MDRTHQSCIVFLDFDAAIALYVGTAVCVSLRLSGLEVEFPFVLSSSASL